MEVSKDPLTIDGRILPAPEILFGSGQKVVRTLSSSKGMLVN
jgi:hypothetical protein